MGISIKDGDILFIDRYIKDVLKKEIDNIDNLKKEHDRLKILCIEGSQNERIRSNYEIVELKTRIKDIVLNARLSVYIYSSKTIIEDYKKLFGKKTFIKKQIIDEKKKNDIIRSFIIIARQYIPIENYMQKSNINTLTCKICDKKLTLDPSNTNICTSCGIEYNDITETISFKDNTRVNIVKRYKYTKKGHFIHAINTFQGKQNIITNRIESDINYILLQMRLHYLTPETTTKDHIHMFISERKSIFSSKKEKYTQFKYEDLNLIYSRITGIPCPNIEHLQDVLLEDFEKQEAAIAIVDPYRLHSLNVNYKLMMLLRKNGMYYTKHDFYILKIDEKEEEHNDILSRAWKHLEWEWIP